jgi:hypothetical protein
MKQDSTTEPTFSSVNQKVTFRDNDKKMGNVFQQYNGVQNQQQGEAFLAEHTVLSPVLSEVAEKMRLYFPEAKGVELEFFTGEEEEESPCFMVGLQGYNYALPQFPEQQTKFYNEYWLHQPFDVRKFIAV